MLTYLPNNAADDFVSLIELRSILTQKLKRVDERKATLMDRMLDHAIDQDTFKEHNTRLREEAEQIKTEMRATGLEGIELEKVLTCADRLILHPDRLWGESSLEQRQPLQKTFFPNGLDFDGEENGTTPTDLLFRAPSLDDINALLRTRTHRNKS